MFGRMKDAMADAAETLRQAFAGLKVVQVEAEPFLLGNQGIPLLQAEPRAGLQVPEAPLQVMQLLREAAQGRGMEPFSSKVVGEAGWASWGAEAEVIRMDPLEAGRAARVAVPPLPRKASALGRHEPVAVPATRRAAEALARPAVRRADPSLPSGLAQAGLETMLSLAVPIQAENTQHLPKGIWMRYSLQLVRGTGENVRNLEVLGLFRIPRKGVADLRHDAKQGRILVRLEAAALRAPRAPFILARRKDDGGLVSCFVEDP
jgi:hypothetical protein